MVRRLCAAAAALTMIAVLTNTAGAAVLAPSAADPVAGISINGLLDDNARLVAAAPGHLADIHADGMTEGRSDATWLFIEPKAPRKGVHTYRFQRYDDLVTQLALHGIRWQPVLAYNAGWSAPHGSWYAAPNSDADYAAYAAAVAARYGSTGTFWAAHPELPRLPVAAYEVWNEPNYSGFWDPPSATAFAALLLRAADSIHAADPVGKVISGGVLYPLSPESFVQSMLAAQPRLLTALDAVGLHPYSGSVRGTLADVRAMRRTVDQAGGPALPLAITEVGWRQTGSGRTDSLPESARAGAYSLMTDALSNSNCSIIRMTPYLWARAGAAPAGDDWFALADGGRSLTPAGDAQVAALSRAAAAPEAPPLPACDPVAGRAYAPALTLGLSLHTDGRKGCLRASVSYHRHDLSDALVLFSDGVERATAGTGDVTHCGLHGTVTATATVRPVAMSASHALRVL